MSEIPGDLKYAKTHEWVRMNDDGTVTIGITDNAQQQLGDMVYVEVPEAGRTLEREEACAVVESVKAASDVYSPVAGDVVEVNEALTESPESVNHQPYGDGWLLRLKPADTGELDALMDAGAYQAFIESGDH
jgi:glycine cleavage system H protein